MEEADMPRKKKTDWGKQKGGGEGIKHERALVSLIRHPKEMEVIRKKRNKLRK